MADFDGDGHLDIATCDEANHELVIYFNSGAGKLSAPLQIESGADMPYSMVAADLNRDGKPEIIVGNVNAPGAIYYNDGSGRKYRKVPFGDNKGAIYGMAVADLDGDGFPDIVAARSDAPSLILFSRPAK